MIYVTWGELRKGDTVVAQQDVFTVVDVGERDLDGWIPMTFLDMTADGSVHHINMSPIALTEPIVGAIEILHAGSP